MTLADFREHCLAKPGVTEETPFGPDTLVFKVSGKMFALTGIDDFVSVNLKCDPEAAADLRERYAYVRPGYHMNKQHWNTVEIGTGVSDAQVRQWTDDSYGLVRASLPKKVQAELDAAGA
ncbi:MAG: MmcQ/YjbR family DNA-binding protein [Hymenobacteraceae bacterium]|nr:MmcQ/YjbR family DNA-binding protein [Hymenobacteraceae bacterium]